MRIEFEVIRVWLLMEMGVNKIEEESIERIMEKVKVKCMRNMIRNGLGLGRRSLKNIIIVVVIVERKKVFVIGILGGSLFGYIIRRNVLEYTAVRGVIEWYVVRFLMT